MPRAWFLPSLEVMYAFFRNSVLLGCFRNREFMSYTMFQTKFLNCSLSNSPPCSPLILVIIKLFSFLFCYKVSKRFPIFPFLVARKVIPSKKLVNNGKGIPLTMFHFISFFNSEAQYLICFLEFKSLVLICQASDVLFELNTFSA